VKYLFLKFWLSAQDVKKGFIAYHKCNGITTMKKHVEFDHYTLLQKLLVDPTNLAPRSPLDCKPSKKRAHVDPSAIFSFFSFASKFKKDDAIQVIFLEDLLLFVIKGLMLMRIIESILALKVGV
jgi:hypothetical protein